MIKIMDIREIMRKDHLPLLRIRINLKINIGAK